jgi:hypothetical protein
MITDNEIYYVIYSPETCRYFLEHGSDPITEYEYLKNGYYISFLPLEYDRIKYKGTEFQCLNVLRAINSFSKN